jgi:uracil-DNA glycosylase
MAITSWTDAISPEKNKPYFKAILRNVKNMRQQGDTIYPPENQVFSALQSTPLETLKAVIIGQDPYHGPRQAHGLCFSVSPGITPPPSLKNIFKALHADLSVPIPNHGCLSAWADQGVLLLNSVLTVEQSKAHSHAHLGWQTFTDCIISAINQYVDRPVVYLLWGSQAIKKSALINNPKHLILQAPHPSPLSAHRGFLTCKHFSKTNEWLSKHHTEPITWDIPCL